MNSKAKRKLLILALNALALIVLLLIRDNQVEDFLSQSIGNAEYSDVMLRAILWIHNKSTYNWIAGISLGLLILNLFSYRQLVHSRKWILEPILILIVSYGLSFSLFTFRTFEIRDQLIEEKRIKEQRPFDPNANEVIIPSEDIDFIDYDVFDSLRTHGMPH